MPPTRHVACQSPPAPPGGPRSATSRWSFALGQRLSWVLDKMIPPLLKLEAEKAKKQAIRVQWSSEGAAQAQVGLEQGRGRGM